MITTILQEANISLKNLPARVAEVRALILRADASQILVLLQQVEKIMKEMDSYRQYIGNKIDALSMQSLQEIVSKQQGHQQDKLLLYLWQILNYLSINLQCLPSFIIDAIQTLVEFNIKYEYFYSENSIKNAEILVHNIISKLLKSKEHFFECQTKIISWLKLLLIHHYEQKDNQYTIFFKYSKKQQSFLGQFEWLGYIFNQLFSQKYFTLGEKRPSLVQKIIESSQNKDKISYYLLHSIGDYFQNIIDKRITTELVYTYEAEIQDIKDMYNKTNEKVLAQIKITQEDLSFICMILKAHLSRHRSLIKQYIYRRLDNTQSQQIARQFTTNEQIIQQIFHLLNCVLFIGGYNNKLQDVIISDILSEDKLLLNYLELTYLIYKNIEATRFKNKVSLLVQVEQTIKKQLFGLISYEEPIGDIDMKGIQLEKVLVNGQLVNVLRLFTNLVHINKNAIKPFEQQPKYLHIILSLTHDNVSQATMRQWAIMFIRNVSEWSQILRDEIGKVKIEMKVV